MTDVFPKDAIAISMLDLQDGYNEPELIFKKAKKILGELARGKRVVVFCAAGLSRSPGMVALIIAFQTYMPYRETLYMIKDDIAPWIQVNSDFQDACEQALSIMNAKLVKRCKCGAPIEAWEEVCEYCYKTRN
jgi:predicted protein tyrosine phosphatase